MPDYVIVGAGSAGCVVAERLSAGNTVALLEAGASNRVREVAIPAAFSKLFESSRDWGYRTAPEPGALERSLYLPRGKMVGGSSSMNAMLYVRGRPSDYDSWAGAGAREWGWDAVLPVFKAMEANSRGADQLHGASGPVRVEDQRSPNPLSRAFVEAAMAAGIPANNDFNGARQDGVGFFQVTQSRGRRWSAADAFLDPSLRRPTLRLISDATVVRVLFDSGSARGVEYVEQGVRRIVYADREVIIAAGTYGSPQLLQLSGVGDTELLGRIGVEPVAENREVGANLQDHPVMGVMYDSLLPGSLDDAENLPELARWLLLRRGRLTSPVAEAGAFVRSTPDLAEPDLQFHFGPGAFANHGLDPYDGHAFTFGPVLINPRSRGWVRARSSDPTAPPEIVTNVLSDERDLLALLRGVRMAREIAHQPPFDRFRGVEVHPGAAIGTDDELMTAIRGRVELLYHPVGTCRMGEDGDAVVDSRLRVRGVDRLRVVDASVMPIVTSGNTNAPTLMIAERGARMILEDQTSNGSAI